MAKIGRNDKCPCRSGKKYKHCCARKELAAIAPQPVNVTLMSAVRDMQAEAENKRVVCRELGVFFFYTTKLGDAWLLEMTESDCVQIAKDGLALEPPIDENSETIEINYSHTFKLENRQLVFTAYADKVTQVLEDAPTRELSAAIRRIRKKFSGTMLQQVHLPTSETPAAT